MSKRDSERRGSLTDASCRVALAAYLHDLGKLTERAEAHDRLSETWAAHATLFCPFHEGDGGYHSHLHAAAGAMAFDMIEHHLPPMLSGDVAPFVAKGSPGEITDSFVNAACMHHKPGTFLQWCVAAADRIASGFEREDFERYNAIRGENFTARLLTPFEEYAGPQARSADSLTYRYPLRALSPESIFPERHDPARSRAAAVSDYSALWTEFRRGLAAIPPETRSNLPLWMDAFDTLWRHVAHAIPAATAFGVRPEVSLYDHSRTTAAFAAAIWRYHTELGHDEAAVARDQARRADWDDAKFLILQGDFSGVQAFIFGGAAQTQRRSARLLRGRSALVSVLCEVAALRMLEELSLPPTSQVLNAAGKFLILAPNTPETHRAVQRVCTEFDRWFLKESLGLSGVIVSAVAAAPSDFIDRRFGALRLRLAQDLERAKLQRFQFGTAAAPDPLLGAPYPLGACRFDARFPAEVDLDGDACSRLSAAQIHLGGWLARAETPVLVIGRNDAQDDERLDVEILGYRLWLGTDLRSVTPSAVRAFDLSLPSSDPGAGLFKGLATRPINAWAPRLQHDVASDPRYDGLTEDVEIGGLKTFEHLARDAQEVDREMKTVGVAALGFLKGDVDDLGRMFATSLGEHPSFAGWSALSRRISDFFSLAVPDMLRRMPQFQDIYTVFAGGDDFVFIGPWKQVKAFAAHLRAEFQRYCAANGKIHFSAAYVMTKPGAPLRTTLERLEAGLSAAKGRPGKNAICLGDDTGGEVLSWEEFSELQAQSVTVGALVEEFRLSTAFLYHVLACADSAEIARRGQDITQARWRSQLTYRTRRHVRHSLQLRDEAAEAAQERLMAAFACDGIDRFSGRYRFALSDHIYRVRRT